MSTLIRKACKAIRLLLSWSVCRFIPINRRRIVISSYYGRGYGDNPKYIVQELLSRGEKLDIIWLVSDAKETDSLPEGVRACIRNSFKGIYSLCTAKIWIDNSRKSLTFYKRKGQIYIQTWHGFALKQIEKDAENELDANYIKHAKKDSSMIDLIISDSSFMTNIYKNSFWYTGETVEWGAPRNDMLILGCPGVKEKVCKELNIPQKHKLVMYAPTFRIADSTEVYNLDCERLKNVCKNRFGGDFTVLLRLHPNIAQDSSRFSYDETTVNASFYPDMQELLASCDVVISDYSSLMFDFALSHKPCFQYAADIEEYKKDRGFYFDLSSLPFTLATDNDELETAITEFNQSEYDSRIDAFYDSVGMVRNGNACALCADYIIKNI